MSTVTIPPSVMRALLASAACLGVAGCGGHGEDSSAQAAAPVTVAPLSCAQLNGAVVPGSAIGLPTNGAKVTSAQVVSATGTGAAAIGEHCNVLGEIDPVDQSAPKIKFQLRLPATWNNKAMMYTGAGRDGAIPDIARSQTGPVDKPSPLGRGYAMFASDSGHQSTAFDPALDASFGGNVEALKNFSGDALKKTHDVAVYLIKARYAKSPAKIYISGGSTGGRESLMAVSNWPQDFDGAISLFPAWDAVGLDLYGTYLSRELAKPGAYPNPQKRNTLLDASMQVCDPLDGATDGIVSNQQACDATFDPATALFNGKPLRCTGGADTGDDCLSDAQINAFKALNSPLKLNYTLASGETGYPGYTAWGSDWGGPGTDVISQVVRRLGLGTDQPADPMPTVSAEGGSPYISAFSDGWVKYFVTGDPGFSSLNFDPANPGRWQNRVVELSAFSDVTKTDLSAFQAKGGKILIMHGTADVLVSNRSTRRYVERLRNTMGIDKVNSFVRHYEIPGFGHAVGTIFNASWDSVTALENWVENATPPVNLVVADTLGVPGRTRPMCEYPSWPKYKGSGDLNAASSYSCATQ